MRIGRKGIRVGTDIEKLESAEEGRKLREFGFPYKLVRMEGDRLGS